MPEIGEVARILHYIHKHLVGKTLAVVKAQHDENVFGKVGTSAAEFEKALTGKKVVGAKQQGKYFWLEMSSPPHPLFHFGMTGWWKFRDVETAYYRPTKPEDPIWPPKYWKFTLETAEEPKCEAAFVDSRRFARIRLVDCAVEDMRKTSPLVENGPDPVIDKDIVTEDWLVEKVGSKRVPVKALLLDQANISGIGNWVGDEILYDARIHPEQYSNTLNTGQLKQLHKSIHYVCSVAVETQSDSSRFPEGWLFKHRWGKGKKDDPKTLPNGDKIIHITVGGRTSAVVPRVQKKTGPVAGGADDENVGNELNGDHESTTEAIPKQRKRTSTSARSKKARTADTDESKKTSDKPNNKRKPEKITESGRMADSDEEQLSIKRAKSSTSKTKQEKTGHQRRSARTKA